MSKANKITDQETVKLKFSLPPKLYRQIQLVDGVDSDPMSAIVERALAYVLGNADDLEQQALRQAVLQEFENYLLENIGLEAVQWLRLYLQGKSQDEIAKKLNKPIQFVNRLREKISYHAVRVFALKGKPELVDNWLSISLKEHNLGLTQKQFDKLL